MTYMTFRNDYGHTCAFTRECPNMVTDSDKYIMYTLNELHIILFSHYSIDTSTYVTYLPLGGKGGKKISWLEEHTLWSTVKFQRRSLQHIPWREIMTFMQTEDEMPVTPAGSLTIQLHNIFWGVFTINLVQRVLCS